MKIILKDLSISKSYVYKEITDVTEVAGKIVNNQGAIANNSNSAYAECDVSEYMYVKLVAGTDNNMLAPYYRIIDANNNMLSKGTFTKGTANEFVLPNNASKIQFNYKYTGYSITYNIFGKIA